MTNKKKQRYVLYFTADRKDALGIVSTGIYGGWSAKNVKTLSRYVEEIKKDKATNNPRDFFYIDWHTDGDECVYL